MNSDPVLDPAKAQTYLMLMQLRAQLQPATIAPYEMFAVPPPPLPRPLRLLAVIAGEFMTIVREGRL